MSKWVEEAKRRQREREKLNKGQDRQGATNTKRWQERMKDGLTGR